MPRLRSIYFDDDYDAAITEILKEERQKRFPLSRKQVVQELLSESPTLQKKLGEINNKPKPIPTTPKNEFKNAYGTSRQVKP